MRKPDTHQDSHQGPSAGPGGKAAERLKMFHEARGFTEDPVAHNSGDYSAAVLQAITAAEAAGPGGPGVTWRYIGPQMVTNGQTSGNSRVTVSGRVSSIAVDPANRNHLLCGAAAGGIWESFTRGADWAPRTDFMRTLTTGAIAFDPNNPATVYAGTGEGNSYWYLGQGILRSTDGGSTWALLADAPFVGRGFFAIVVDPANSQHLLAATRGLAAAGGVAATGGVYESADGGLTWAQVYAATSCWDISMQRGGGPNSEVLAAGPDGLQRSTDGGHTWAAQNLPGAPASWTRLAVSITPFDGATAYAFGASQAAGWPAFLWRRSNGVWAAMTIPRDLKTSQAYYDWYVAAAPDRADQVYLGAYDAHRGELAADGTTWTWTNLSGKDPGDDIHPDQHAIAFDPVDPAVIYCGNDGGVFRSPDRGTTWVSLNPGLCITEIEYMVHDNASSRWLLAGTQDNGNILFRGTTAFELVDDGDGGDCGVDQTNPATCYNTFINMKIYRSTQGGAWNTFANISPRLPQGYQSLFYPPVGVAGNTVAIAGQSVFLSRDTGTTWTEVNLPGGSTREIATALYLPSADLVYAATKTGRIFTITYAGGRWSDPPVELASPRRGGYVSAIRVDPSSRIWVTMSQVGAANAGGQVWRSDDNGRTWADRTGNLPALPITSIAFLDTNADRVWVSADVGVYQSGDGGGNWQPFFQSLPYVIVEDLEYHPASRVLRAGTRSRGIWEIPVFLPDFASPWPGLRALALSPKPASTLMAFGVGTDKSVSYLRQTSPGGDWTQFAPCGGGFTATSALTLARSGAGSLSVFARGPDGALWYTYAADPGPGTSPAWAAWSSLGGLLNGNPVAARNQDGRLEVFARGHDGRLWHIYQTTADNGPASGWGAGWSAVGGVATSAPALALNLDGRLEVFALGNDGTLRHSYQTNQGSSASWSAWESLGGVLIGNPTVAANQDGRLEVFARGPDSQMRHTCQAAANNRTADGWLAWEALGDGRTISGDPVAAANQDGRLEVFALGASSDLVHMHQAAANNRTADGWTLWLSERGGMFNSDPAVGSDQDGRLYAFMRRMGGIIPNWVQFISQTDPNGDWTGWQDVNGNLLAFP